MAFDGEKLTELRKGKRLSIYNLSLLSNIERTTIVRLESGMKVDPQVVTVARLANTFSVPNLPVTRH